jgi:hypothetical protein
MVWESPIQFRRASDEIHLWQPLDEARRRIRHTGGTVDRGCARSLGDKVPTQISHRKVGDCPVPQGSLPLASSRLPSPTRDTEATDHNQQISFDKIWYAAYGANLFPHRLNWYLHGGKAPTSSHWYTPCPDGRPIQARFAGKLPYRLYFTRQSLIWGGSKAFIDRIPEPDTDKHAQAAFYLLSREQFEHVVWQENWQSERPSPLSLDLEGLAKTNRASPAVAWRAPVTSRTTAP